MIITSPVVPMAQRPLILANNTTPLDAQKQIANDRMPRIDYLDLHDKIGGEVVDQSLYNNRYFRLLEMPERTMRLRWGQAFYALRNWHEYDLIYSTSEDVGVPMAVLQSLFGRKTRQVVIVHSVLSLQKYAVYRLLRVMPTFSKIIALTRCTAEQIIQKYRLPSERVTCILDGVDERFWRPQPQIAVDPGLVISLGQARRDYDMLIQAVSGLPLQLHIQASSQWYVQYKAQVGELPQNVSFGTYLPFPRLRELYARASVVVVPLQPGAHHSAGSVTLKEAMAMGKAVVVASPGGAEDYIEHGETGIIVPAGNGLALREAIRMLVSDPVLARKMGERARQVVETKLSYEQKISRLAAEAKGKA